MARPVKTLGFVLAFGVAMWSLSSGWSALRATWQAPTSAGLAATLGYAGLFLVTFLYLGFWLYAADRTAGRVQRQIGLYERIIKRREQGTREQGMKNG